jgi:hypothetical protein
MTFVGIEGGVANEKTCPYEGSRFERSRRSQIPDTQIILQGTLYSLLTVDELSPCNIPEANLPRNSLILYSCQHFMFKSAG